MSKFNFPRMKRKLVFFAQNTTTNNNDNSSKNKAEMFKKTDCHNYYQFPVSPRLLLENPPRPRPAPSSMSHADWIGIRLSQCVKQDSSNSVADRNRNRGALSSRANDLLPASLRFHPRVPSLYPVILFPAGMMLDNIQRQSIFGKRGCIGTLSFYRSIVLQSRKREREGSLVGWQFHRIFHLNERAEEKNQFILEIPAISREISS